MTYPYFQGRLDITYDAQASKVLEANYWRVLNPLIFHISETEHVTIPAGYLTDGASVPRAFWSVVPPWGPYAAATTLHDLLCEYLSIIKDGKPCAITRERCDELLDIAMRTQDVDDDTRETIYKAVCLYRKVSGASAPTQNPTKRQLEAAWAA
ncbi:DUF1353 domain-containing protein [Pseudomonas luteola]|uniref:DUF1353 domain-containing protein n=1 Tax=Pseudomonas luteola TaxID=47886 RepID=UPI003A86887A